MSGPIVPPPGPLPVNAGEGVSHVTSAAAVDPYQLLTTFAPVNGLVPPGALLAPVPADYGGLLGNGTLPVQTAAAGASQMIIGAQVPTVAALPTFMTSSVDGVAATSAHMQPG